MIKRSAWAVLDQGLFAGANFIANLLLARWMTPEEYGVFTVLFALLLLVGTMHSAFWIEPMLVYGKKKFNTELPRYLSFVAGNGFLATSFAALILVASGIVISFIDDTISIGMMLPLLLAVPVILTMWLLRRACFVCDQPRLAVIGATLYALLVLLGVSSFKFNEILSVHSIFILLAVISLIVGAFFMKALAMTTQPSVDSIYVKDVSALHMNYGRWGLWVGLLIWVLGNFYFVVLAYFDSAASAGALRAVWNLYMPLLHAFAAISVAVIPLLAEKEGAHSGGIRLVLIIALSVSFSYLVVLAIFSDPILNLLYDQKYSGQTQVVIGLGLMTMAYGIIAMYSTILRAREKMKSLFRAYSVGGAITLFIGSIVTIKYGVSGAAISMAAIYSIVAMLLIQDVGKEKKAANIT